MIGVLAANYGGGTEYQFGTVRACQEQTATIGRTNADDIDNWEQDEDVLDNKIFMVMALK